MPKGGRIGFFCHHQYAHAHKSARKSLPLAFKGVDLAIYSVFRSLGLSVGIHPIIRNRSKRTGGISMKQLLQDDDDHADGDHVELLMDKLREEEENGDPHAEGTDRATIVGKELHAPTFDKNYDEDDIEYGNQAELNYQFSAAAIIVVVPPASDRISAPATGGALNSGRPPLKAHSDNTMGGTSTVAANTSGGDAAVSNLTAGTEGEDQASTTTV
ncbi:MAG: hypothetical protein Q9184_008153 [Pyrenodesmia sp. 2 TL-2023]